MKAKKLTFANQTNSNFKKYFSKITNHKQLAYEVEIVFYKRSENISDHLITIVIPARNEAGNKKLLIDALNKF